MQKRLKFNYSTLIHTQAYKISISQAPLQRQVHLLFFSYYSALYFSSVPLEYIRDVEYKMSSHPNCQPGSSKSKEELLQALD